VERGGGGHDLPVHMVPSRTDVRRTRVSLVASHRTRGSAIGDLRQFAVHLRHHSTKCRAAQIQTADQGNPHRIGGENRAGWAGSEKADRSDQHSRQRRRLAQHLLRAGLRLRLRPDRSGPGYGVLPKRRQAQGNGDGTGIPAVPSPHAHRRPPRRLPDRNPRQRVVPRLA